MATGRKAFEFGGRKFRREELAALGENRSPHGDSVAWVLLRGAPGGARQFVGDAGGTAEALAPHLAGLIPLDLPWGVEAWIDADELSSARRSYAGIQGTERLELPSGGWLLVLPGAGRTSDDEETA